MEALSRAEENLVTIVEEADFEHIPVDLKFAILQFRRNVFHAFEAATPHLSARQKRRSTVTNVLFPKDLASIHEVLWGSSTGVSIRDLLIESGTLTLDQMPVLGDGTFVIPEGNDPYDAIDFDIKRIVEASARCLEPDVLDIPKFNKPAVVHGFLVDAVRWLDSRNGHSPMSISFEKFLIKTHGLGSFEDELSPRLQIDLSAYNFGDSLAESDVEKVNEAVKVLSAKKGVKQTDICNECAINPSTLSRWLNNKTAMPFASEGVKKVLKYLEKQGVLLLMGEDVSLVNS